MIDLAAFFLSSQLVRSGRGHSFLRHHATLYAAVRRLGALHPETAAEGVVPEVVADVLLLDAEEHLQTLIEDFCGLAGLRACSVWDGASGLSYFRRSLETCGRAPGTVVADSRLADVPLLDLAQEIKALAPATRMILLLGSEAEAARLADSPAFDAILHKPCNLSDLLAQITAPPPAAEGD